MAAQTAVLSMESVTKTVNVKVPDMVGVPETVPIAGSRLSPGGSAPAVIENV
jgi:hypothetical protein